MTLLASTALPKARRITHVHLLAVVMSECRHAAAGTTVRLLHVGCGNGHLMAYLDRSLCELRRDVTWEIHGLDVQDHGVQADGFLSEAIALLVKERPGIAWDQRVTLLTQEAPWPYDAGVFDVIVSNQVLEHVRDHRRLLGEIKSTLAVGGFSAHLFALRHYVYEGHLHLPWVHRIGDTDILRAYIAACSRLSLAKYREYGRRFGVSVAEYSARHADYMQYFTNYLTQRDAMRLVKQAGLRGSFRHTPGFYTNKLRAIMCRPACLQYSHRHMALAHWLAVRCLRYVSSVTCFWRTPRGTPADDSWPPDALRAIGSYPRNELMCGFAIKVGLSGKPLSRDWLATAGALLEHRGPDAGALHASTSAVGPSVGVRASTAPCHLSGPRVAAELKSCAPG